MPVVKELLADYTFKKAEGFDALRPEVSVVLPTYRRAKSGLFRNAVATLLAQDFKNIELIIIDDCSTDGTETIIDEFMSIDPRIATVRFKENIGLPAISVNLGIELARGQKILTAFDDNEFTKDGLAALVEAQKADPTCKISFGKALYRRNSKPKKIYLGTQEVLSQNLQATNLIGAAATLVDRSVYETVGLYEPSIGMIRFWGWDLWTRANLYFSFKKVDILVNEEKGMLLADALGNSVKVHLALVQEIMHKYRNDILSFANWKDVDITEGYKDLSLSSQLVLKKIAISELKGRFGVPSVVCSPGDDGYILLVTVKIACAELPFDVTNGKVLFVHPGLFLQDPTDFIRGAKTIIFVREVFAELYRLSLNLRKLDIPYYFFIDDNLFCEEYITKYNSYHGTSQARDFLRHAKGIIASTPLLCEEMKVFNDNLISAERPLTCTLIAPLEREFSRDLSHFNFGSPSQPSLKIGYISTNKSQGFIALKDGFVALQKKLGVTIELHCWVFASELESMTAAFSGLPGISLHFDSPEHSYPKFCINLRSHKLHFLIHAQGEELQELYPYKTYNYLITASFCNAVPIITNRPPYDRLKTSNPEFAPLIADTSADVIKTIEDVVLHPALAEQYLTKCKDFVDRAYPIQHNIDILNELLRVSDGPYLVDISVELRDPDLSVFRQINTRPQFYASVKGCMAFACRRVIRVFKKAFIDDVAKGYRKLRSLLRSDKLTNP